MIQNILNTYGNRNCLMYALLVCFLDVVNQPLHKIHSDRKKCCHSNTPPRKVLLFTVLFLLCNKIPDCTKTILEQHEAEKENPYYKLMKKIFCSTLASNPLLESIPTPYNMFSHGEFQDNLVKENLPNGDDILSNIILDVNSNTPGSAS